MGDDDTGNWSAEIRAGSESTLEKLYRDVPAAEEYDLVEREARVEVQRDVDARLSDDAEDDEAYPGDDVDPDDDEPLSPGQTIGMIEHLLDAEEIDEPTDEPTDD